MPKIFNKHTMRKNGGGVEVIWAMPERNRFFSCEVFPYVIPKLIKSQKLNFEVAIVR